MEVEECNILLSKSKVDYEKVLVENIVVYEKNLSVFFLKMLRDGKLLDLEIGKVLKC